MTGTRETRFECPEGYGPSCRNPLCRVQYAIQARKDVQHFKGREHRAARQPQNYRFS